MISRRITFCRPLAWESRARLTNSRDARENVWARIARAAQGHDVSPIRMASDRRLPTLRYAETMISTASVGITRTMFVSMLSTSSMAPPR